MRVLLMTLYLGFLSYLCDICFVNLVKVKLHKWEWIAQSLVVVHFNSFINPEQDGIFILLTENGI